MRWGQLSSDPDISITRGGFSGSYPDRDDDGPATRQVEAILEHSLKLLLFRNDVVSRQHGHDTCRRARANERRAQGHRGTGIASAGLGNDVLRGQLTELLLH